MTKPKTPQELGCDNCGEEFINVNHTCKKKPPNIVMIRLIDEESCRVHFKSDKTNIEQEFLLTDIPELLKDLTNDYL